LDRILAPTRFAPFWDDKTIAKAVDKLVLGTGILLFATALLGTFDVIGSVETNTTASITPEAVFTIDA